MSYAQDQLIDLFQVIDEIENVRINGLSEVEVTWNKEAFIPDRKETEPDADKIYSYKPKPGERFISVRLTQDSYSTISQLFDVDIEELKKLRGAPSSSAPFFVGGPFPGGRSWVVYKPREFHSRFGIESETGGVLKLTTGPTTFS